MNLEKRIEKLESTLLIEDVDPRLDLELTDWFKSNPDYQPFAQPENNESVVMPNHLIKAFQQRIVSEMKRKGVQKNLCGLLEVADRVYP